jgi:dTDP-4-dehydrorhamnose 3,5-epimerase
VIDSEQEAILGVEVHPLKELPGERGALLHMLRSDSPFFDQFGEVYFSEVNPGAIKAWKRHLRMTQRLAVPVGTVRFVLYDDRADSPTKGRFNEWILGRPSAYRLLIIPPQIWYGFQGIDPRPSLIANCPNLPHDQSESQRRPFDDPAIPYRWSLPS